MYMKHKIELRRGDKFNNLTFIKDVGNFVKGGALRRHSEFKCVCGLVTSKITNQVTRGKTKSCGKCSLAYVIPHNEGNKNGGYRHGMYGTRFYAIFFGMISRCKNKANRYYGGKGIKVEWKNFIDFKNDMYKSYLKHCGEFGVKNTTIDRIDSSKHYSKQNCRWATYKEQAGQKKTAHPERYLGPLSLIY